MQSDFLHIPEHLRKEMTIFRFSTSVVALAAMYSLNENVLKQRPRGSVDDRVIYVALFKDQGPEFLIEEKPEIRRSQYPNILSGPLEVPLEKLPGWRYLQNVARPLPSKPSDLSERNCRTTKSDVTTIEHLQIDTVTRIRAANVSFLMFQFRTSCD